MLAVCIGMQGNLEESPAADSINPLRRPRLTWPGFEGGGKRRKKKSRKAKTLPPTWGLYGYSEWPTQCLSVYLRLAQPIISWA